MARGFKTGGRKKGTRNKATVLREEAVREALRAQGDAPDLPPIPPHDIMLRVANRLFSKAAAARARGDYPLEETLLKAAAAAAEKAAPYSHAKIPTVVVGPDSLPSLRRMSMKQLKQLLVDLGEDEYQDITGQEAAESGRDQARNQPLEGPQEPIPVEPSEGSRA